MEKYRVKGEVAFRLRGDFDKDWAWLKYRDVVKALQEFAKGLGYILDKKDAEAFLDDEEPYVDLDYIVYKE
jgi:hypothetical protein